MPYLFSMYNVLMISMSVTSIVKTREEKKILQKLLIAYRSFLIRREREKKRQEREANARYFLENSLVDEPISKFGIWGEYVCVRYNKSSIVKGRIVGHPNEKRERFCLEWYDEDRMETRRKYFPFTAIVSYKTIFNPRGVRLCLKPKYQLPEFDFTPYSEYPQFIEYIKDYIEAPDERLSIRDKIENGLYALSRDVKFPKGIPLETIRKNEEAFWEYRPYWGFRDRIVFLHNRIEVEGEILSPQGTSDKYMKVESPAIMTKDHIKYVPIGYFCRVIRNPKA